MNQFLIGIVLFVLIFLGCTPQKNEIVIENTDLEMNVINDILPELIPEHPPCSLAPIEGESNKDYDDRLDAFYREVDSVGKKIEIVSLFTKLDSNYIDFYEQIESSKRADHLLNAPNKDRRIDSTMIKEINGFQVIFVKDPRRTEGAGLTDCYTFGQFNISRVGFNGDSTRAAFKYFIDNGSCFIEDEGIINVELKNGRWQTVIEEGC